jgi:hypothetical protein
LYNIPKLGKIHQIALKCSKRQQNRPNCWIIYQKATKYTNIFHCKMLQIYPNWEFGLGTSYQKGAKI